MLRLPSSSSIVAASARAGGRYRADMRTRLDGTVARTRRRCLHVCAAELFRSLATDGPFGPGNAAVALEATADFYREHGFELAGPVLGALAEVTAAGYLGEADLVAIFEQRALPAPSPVG